MFPVSDNTKPFKTVSLDIYILFGICFAGRAEFRHAHCLVIELLFLNDCRLNRHSVVVPSRNIRCPVSTHCIGTDYKILQSFIQCMTHMNGTVGKRRTVMQGKAWFPFILFQKLMVYVKFFPSLQHLRLALRQTCTHGKLCFREIEGCVKILCHS